MIKIIPMESGDSIIINWNVLGHLAGWIETLFSTSKNLKNCGILTAQVIDGDNRIFDFGGSVIPKVCMPHSDAFGEQYYGQFGGTREVEVARLLCAIVKKELLEKILLPEEIGTSQFIDADFCLEAKKLGFKTYTTDEVIVRYKGDICNFETPTDFALDYEEKYQIFAEKWGKEYTEPLKTPVVFQSSIFQPSGFGMAARGYIKGLTKNGVNVCYNYLRGTNDNEPESGDCVVDSICEDHGNLEMPQVIWAQAPYFNKNSGKYKIGFCEIEGDLVPDDWIRECNQMDEIWVPTNWDRQKFRKAGVTVPIFVFGQGVDSEYFHPAIAPIDWEKPEGFNFLFVGAWDPRKNIPNLVKAFQTEFTSEEPVSLTIKTINLGLVDDISEEIKKLKMNEEGGQVRIIEAELKHEELASMYTASDCFVLPTHGEAWGLPLFEALACGIPIITTGYGAPNELLRDEAGEPLPGVHFLKYQKALAQTNYVYLQDTYWAEPSIPDLMAKMRHVYENSKEEKEKALQTSQIIRDKYDWQEITKPIKERLDVIYKEHY